LLGFKLRDGLRIGTCDWSTRVDELVGELEVKVKLVLSVAGEK